MAEAKPQTTDILTAGEREENATSMASQSMAPQGTDAPSCAVSVIVPAYNAAATIERCLRSVLDQQGIRPEVIVVDDGSADKTPEILDSMAEQEPRLTVLHQANAGAAAARNRGIREASGRWLGFVDADDYVEPDMFARLYEAAERLEHQKPWLIQIGRFEEDEAGRPLPDVVDEVTGETPVPSVEFVESLLKFKGDSSLCTKLVPRDLLMKHPFQEGRTGEDFALLMEILPLCGGVYRLPGRGYHVVVRSGSVTRSASENDFPRAFSDVVARANEVHLRINGAAKTPGDPSEYVLSLIADGERDVLGKHPEFYARWNHRLRKAAEFFGINTRLDYLLHIPIARMRSTNPEYMAVVRDMRMHLAAILTNPHLPPRSRLYALLLAIAPLLVRRVHRGLMERRRRGAQQDGAAGG